MTTEETNFEQRLINPHRSLTAFHIFAYMCCLINLNLSLNIYKLTYNQIWNVKASTVHSQVKNTLLPCWRSNKYESLKLSSNHFIIMSMKTNIWITERLKCFENILGINKCKRTALILGFLFDDFDINITYITWNELYVGLNDLP